MKAEAPSENPRTPESKSSAKDPQTPRTRTGQPHQKDLSPATPKQIRKRKILDGDLTPPRPEVNPEMAERIGLIMGERNKKRQAKVKDAHAKRLIRESGLDFNLHFQKMHAGMVVEKSHWSSFKKCIAGEGDLTCAVCQNLVVHHCIKISRFEAEVAKPPIRMSNDRVQVIVIQVQVIVIQVQMRWLWFLWTTARPRGERLVAPGRTLTRKSSICATSCKLRGQISTRFLLKNKFVIDCL